MRTSLPNRGAVLWIRHERWRVECASRDHDVLRLDVVGDSRRRTFLLPFDRPVAGTPTHRARAVRRDRAVGRLAGLIARRASVRAPLALLDARVGILPHQLEPLMAVLSGDRRVLIADDVGLGKTIQAGAIVAELLRRQGTLRALIVVPASLRTQWARELSDRFGIASRLIDRDASETSPDDVHDQDLWAREPVHVASIDFMKQPHVMGGLPKTPWDVVIIDEAHDVCGESDRHRAASTLARRGRHVLLLTATPHSGDEARFERLMALGTLPGIADPPTVFRRTRADVSSPQDRCVRWHRVRPSPAAQEVLDALVGYERAVLAEAGRHGMDAALLLLSVFRKRALSTMAALDDTLGRRLAAIERTGNAVAPDWHQPRFNGLDDRDDVSDDERQGLDAAIGMPRVRERAWLRRLRHLSGIAAAVDHKMIRLRGLVSRCPEPVVIFTEFRSSLAAIERWLAADRNVIAVHGGLTPDERSRRVDVFLHGSASALIATDVASQGLNLQSRARWVVNVELPWNPVRLQQRIGRVDRIGQTRRVHATMLIARHDAEAGLLARLAARALAVHRALGEGSAGEIAWPAEDQVARGLIAGATVRPPRLPAVIPATRWRRLARAAARDLTTRRGVLRQWRAPERAGGRPWIVRRRTHQPSGPRRAIVVLIVPIVDDLGCEVERHLAGVLMPADTAGDDVLRQIHSGALGPTIARRFERRLVRIQRLIDARSTKALHIEKALTDHLVREASPTLMQTALFDHHVAQEVDRAVWHSSHLEKSLAARASRLRRESDLRIGRPAVEVVFWPYP